jgi:hypothetical protein
MTPSSSDTSHAVPPFKTEYFISPKKHEKAAYQTLPVPTLNSAPNL